MFMRKCIFKWSIFIAMLAYRNVQRNGGWLGHKVFFWAISIAWGVLKLGIAWVAPLFTNHERPFGKGPTTVSLGDLRSWWLFIILLTGMILQVPSPMPPHPQEIRPYLRNCPKITPTTRTKARFSGLTKALSLRAIPERKHCFVGHHLKRNIVFQPSFLRGYVSFRGSMADEIIS